MRWLTAQAPPKVKAKAKSKSAAAAPAPEAGEIPVKKEWVWSLACGDWIGPLEISFWGMAHRSQSQQNHFYELESMIAMHPIPSKQWNTINHIS